jgi:exonuclease SbcC
MRILNIYFKNINSLEGETRIDFTEAPFSDTGVFAITGPNGSGKSSILDAITLGLYGETFRFDKPAAHVMTEQTAECFAIIEFSLDSERYQSSWRVERAGGSATGELQAAVMRLVRLNSGETLANTAQQVCAKITEITSMNFRNFTRSILLAQGDFAAFLNALDAERMDILEKIISTDIYADYKKQVIDQAEQIQQVIDRTRQKLAAISLLPAEKQQAYEHDLIDYQEQYAELLAEQTTLKEQEAAVKNIAFVQAQIEIKNNALQQAKTDAQNLQQQLQRIDANQNALIFKEQADLLQEKEQVIKQSKADLAALQAELVQLKSRLADQPVSDLNNKSVSEQQQIIGGLKTKVGQLTATLQSEIALARTLETQRAEKQNDLAALETWLADHKVDESLLTQFPEIGKLSKLQADLQELNAQHKKLAKQAKDSAAALDGNTAALQKEQKNIAEAKIELAADEHELAELVAKHTLAEVDALRVDQQERAKSFQELYDLASAHQRLVDKSGFSFLSLFGGKKELPELDINVLMADQEELKQEVLREENIKILLEKVVFYEGLVKKLTVHREHLVDGKPCPLCGATQHPYSIKPPMLSDSQQELINQQIKIKNILARTYNVARLLEQTQKQHENKSSTYARRNRLSSNWLNLCNRLNASRPELNINNLDLMEELLEAEKQELKDITALGTLYRQKQNNIAKLETSIQSSTAAIERLEKTIVAFSADFEILAQQQIELEQKLQQCQQEERDTQQQVLAQLSALGEKMPTKDKDALFDRLTARKQDYHSTAFRYKNLSEEQTLLITKQATCEQEINYCKQQLDEIGKSLQSEENIGLQLVLVEKQKLIADRERLLQEQSAELGNVQQALTDRLQNTAFTSLTALHEILALVQSQPQLAQQLEQLNSEIIVKTQQLEQSRSELDADLKLAETALSPEQFNGELKRINEQMELASLDSQRLEKLLAEQKKQQQQYDALLLQLQQQENEAQPYLAERALLDTENGMVFRRRVQQQLANKLLAATNTILEKISGRYYLRQTPTEQGLALIVEDTLQGNVQRLPKTLSGGESFVVSLALALGLSELANNGRSVDSLFLDEGFGNLDAETLYIIISTLENLHTHGKTVGVISHVEAVQKRFKAQLEVVKKPNGMGMLKKAS